MSDLAAQAGDIESSDLTKITTDEETPPETPSVEASEYEVSAEELEAYVNQRFAPTPEVETETAEVETTEAPEVEQEEPSAPEPETQPEPTGTLSPEQIQAYQQFDEILKGNPQLSQLVTGVLSGDITLDQAQAIAAQTEVTPDPTPPPDLDLDDPAIRHLYEQNQAQAAALQELRQSVAAHDDFLGRQQRETSESLVNRARTSFQERYELDDTAMAHVEQIAAGLQIVPALAQGFNPSTGQYESPDTLTALDRALEVAYWSQHEYRDREYQRQMTQRTVDNKRKQKLAAVSGNSGSVPRSQPTPNTQEGRRQAMIQEVATAMSGNTVSGD